MSGRPGGARAALSRSGRPAGHANISAMSERVKVHFPIEVEDGWPPVSGESMWAVHVEDEVYRLENTPFFVRGAAFGDLVQTWRDAEGVLTVVSV